MKKRLLIGLQALLSAVLFALLCAAGDTNFNIPVHIAFLAYLIYLGSMMMRRANAFITRLDTYGTWDDIRLKINETDPKAKPPGKYSSQRYIWFVWHNYDFGDDELERLRKEYKPYIILFYGLFIAFVLKLAI